MASLGMVVVAGEAVRAEGDREGPNKIRKGQEWDGEEVTKMCIGRRLAEGRDRWHEKVLS